ncbi:MAG: polysaccharide biosynthesis tyrosine autokinase [Lentisphaeria bacterium]
MSDNTEHQNQPIDPGSAQNSGNGSGGNSGSEQFAFFGDLVDPRQYLDVVRQYWWLVLLVLLVGTGIGAAYCTFATKLYRASCQYEVFRESRLSLTSDDEQYRRTTPIEDELNRQIVIMKSSSLNNRVIKQLSPEYEAKIGEKNLQPEIDIDRVREAVTMVDIKVDAVSKKYALDYLEKMLEVYKAMRRQEILESSEQALSGLKEEQADIGRELDAAREALTQFRKKHNLKYTQTKSWYDEQFLANLVQRENSLRMQKTMLESQFDFLEDANVATIQDALNLTVETQISAQDLSNVLPDASTSEGMEENITTSRPGRGGSAQAGASEMKRLQWNEEFDWQNKQAEMQRLQAEYKDKQEIYKLDHPKMIELKNEVDAAKRDLKLAAEIALKRLKARFSALDLQLQAVRKAAQTWRRELELTTDQRAEYATLQAKVDHLKKLYERVYTRILDGSVVDVDALFSRLVEVPKFEPDPVWPAKTKIMVLAVLLSLGVGVSGAFGLDYLDTRFQDILVIEERLNLPYMSGIPKWERVTKGYKHKDNNIMVGQEDASTSTETYRALRDSIEQAMGNHEKYALAFTSGEANEGKTSTVINTAILFARTGKKVLMVDGDFRRGSCHREFGLDREPGICEFLAGNVATWQEIVRTTDTGNLDVLTAGKYHDDIPETFSTSRIKDLIDEWKQEYDLIIFDTAPAGHIVDTAMISRACDGVLLVVRHGQASVASVKHALHRLGGANMIGFCLNSIDLGNQGLGYYKRYSNVPYGRYAYPYQYYYSPYNKSEKGSKSTNKS